ncbi:MAG: PRC-barrel domain-containing protein [Isosphaeraceae bacterium]
MRTMCALAVGLVLGGAGLAFGQVEVRVGTPAPPLVEAVPTPVPAPANASEVRRISQILGATVQLQGVNNFGRVEDAVIDENGAIAYLVVGNNGRNVMLPWSEASFNLTNKTVVYNVPPQAVQTLYFEGNAWPNVWAPQYVTRVRRIFPGINIIRRELVRPVVPAVVPAPATVVPGAVVPAPVVPPGGVVEERVKVGPGGRVTVKERVR